MCYELQIASYDLCYKFKTCKHELKFKSMSSNPRVTSSHPRVTGTNPRVQE